MNLAEIRKKARQHKDREETTPDEAQQPDSGISVEGSECPPATMSLPEDAKTDQACPDTGEENFFDERPAIHDVGCDPLQVLLAGRRHAGRSSDTVAVPHDISSQDEEDVLKYLRFRVAGEEYGVSLLEIREIIKSRAITEVPRMPEFIPGVLSLRGSIIPVIDLRLRLGLPVTKPSGCERVIIAKHGEGSCGLLVDEVYQVIGMHGTAIDKTPSVLEGINREFVKGIGRQGELMLILLDLDKVMDVSLVE